MQEPQLVPAFNFAPISAAECAPAAMASQMVVRPTPKQAQTIGPALARPSADLPESSMRRWTLLSASAVNRPLTTFQSPASRAGPTNRQVSIRSPANGAGGKMPPPKSLYSAKSSPACDFNQDCQPARSALSANR